jgi:hypothetical protein
MKAPADSFLYRRTSSQKPGDEFIANFRQTFPEVATATTQAGSNSGNTSLGDAIAVGPQPERYINIALKFQITEKKHWRKLKLQNTSLQNFTDSPCTDITASAMKRSKILTRPQGRKTNHGGLHLPSSIRTHSRSAASQTNHRDTILPRQEVQTRCIIIKLATFTPPGWAWEWAWEHHFLYQLQRMASTLRP